MKRNFSIQIKAAFLLLVFASNALMGFACAIEMNMGLNSKHHHDGVSAGKELQVHDNGKTHLYQNGCGKANNGKTHHHEMSDNQHKSNDSQDNCCNGKLIKFEQLDKSIAQIYVDISPVIVAALISSFFYTQTQCLFKATSIMNYFVRSYHPPIPDIRIANHSFQI